MRARRSAFVSRQGTTERGKRKRAPTEEGVLSEREETNENEERDGGTGTTCPEGNETSSCCWIGYVDDSITIYRLLLCSREDGTRFPPPGLPPYLQLVGSDDDRRRGEGESALELEEGEGEGEGGKGEGEGGKGEGDEDEGDEEGGEITAV